MKTTNKEKGRITSSGMGGFLNPPTHPEHTMHVEIDLRRRPENRGGLSLSSAVDCDWLDAGTRMAAKAVLNSWQAPPMESAEIQAWILQVLGYFRSCYQGTNGSWNAYDLVIDKERDPVVNADTHAGVNLIRKYYPSFVPSAEHFQNAKWGN